MQHDCLRQPAQRTVGNQFNTGAFTECSDLRKTKNAACGRRIGTDNISGINANNLGNLRQRFCRGHGITVEFHRHANRNTCHFTNPAVAFRVGLVQTAFRILDVVIVQFTEYTNCFRYIPPGAVGIDSEDITNSYHVNVREPIDAFAKLDFESRFQKMSPGGAISYVEVPNLNNNVLAVIRLIQYMYDHIMYAEINTKSDYCQKCGYDGEIQIVEDDGKLVWECPVCGNRDQKMMNVARRTCGYIGTQFWNQGRTAEIRDRVMHL